MEKEFTVIAPCAPARHYLVDISTRVSGAMRMIATGKRRVKDEVGGYGQ